MTQNSENVKYDFGKKFQTALLYCILKDYTFLRKYRDVVNPDFFGDECFSIVCRSALDSFDKYAETPSIESLEQGFSQYPNCEDLRDTIYYILQNPVESFKAIEEEAINFARTRAILNSQVEAEDLVKVGDFDGAKAVITKAFYVGTNQSLGYDYADEETVISRMESYDGTEPAIPLGLEELDRLMEGGSHRKEMGLFVAPPSGGKTTFLTHLGKSALFAGYNVIHYSLELRKQRVARRYDMAIAGVTKEELRSMKLSSARKIMERVKGKLIIQEYPAASVTCDTFRAHMSRLIDEGIRPDLILLDYGDLVNPSKMIQDTNRSTKDLYKDIRSLCFEFDAALWTATQTNKKVFEMEEDQVITGKEAEGSLEAKFGTPDIVITGNQTYNEYREGLMRMHLAKNREGSAKITIPYRLDFSKMTIGEM